MSIPISFKRGSSVALSGVNPLFLAGELVYETDTFKFKIGDGTSSYNDLPFAFSGFYQPSGNYSAVGHTHISSNITDFATSVSGLLPVKNIVAGSNITISSTSGIFTINSTASGGSSDATIHPFLLGGM